jgi:uncharacterized membrane protein
MWLVLFPILKSIWNVIKPVLTISIPLPLFVLLLAGIFIYYDRESAITKAVNSAVTKLVAGSELAAKDAIIAGQADTIMSQKMFEVTQDERITSAEAANKEFQTNLESTTLENKTLLERLNNVKPQTSTPGKPDSCGKLTQPLYDIMRNQ